jgi:hypothetical protein
VPIGEPIAAVNWCKDDAAQQRKLKNPQGSTPMEFLVGTSIFVFAIDEPRARRYYVSTL